MWHKLPLVLWSAILAGSALSASYAQDQQQSPSQQAAPAQTAPSGHMTGNKEMMNPMQGQMANPQMQAQMLRMMENCNKMMESMMQQSAATPAPRKGG
jgi:hypothetical protein